MKKYTHWISAWLLMSPLVLAQVPTVGVLKVVDHPALNATELGIRDTLADSPLSPKLKVHSAQGSTVTAAQVAQQLVLAQPQALVGIGTPVAQSLLQQAKKTNIPVFFSSVTDPASAGLISSVPTDPQASGVSNWIDLNPQLELMVQLVPNLKSLGVIYNSGEPNSEVIVNRLQALTPRLDIKLVAKSVTCTNEVPLATHALLAEVDALFITNDNLALSAFGSILKEANKKKKPVFVSDTDLVQQGALAALGPNQYDLGRQTGEMILSYLKNPSDWKPRVEYPKSTQTIINLRAAHLLGLHFTEKQKELADMLLN